MLIRRISRHVLVRTETLLRWTPIVAGVVVTALAAKPVLAGATLHVPTEYTTIQSAVTAANYGDTIIVGPGIYHESVDVDKAVTIQSTVPYGATVDSQGSSSHIARPFRFGPGASFSAVLDGFVLTNGYASQGGGILVEGSSPTIQHCKFLHNNATMGGGAIYTTGSYSQILDCDLHGNTSINSPGGGIYTYGGAPRLSECRLTGNKATGGDGGGIYQAIGSLQLVDSVLKHNVAEGPASNGGALATVDGSVIVDRVVMSENNAAYGGAIQATRSGLGIFNSTFHANVAILAGGGLYITGADDGIAGTNVTIYGNTAASAGAIGGDLTTMTFKNTIVWGNGTAAVDAGSPIFTYSCVQYGATGTGNIATDPLFLNPAVGNFHLQPGSPCLNAGTPDNAPSIDADGNTRPNPPGIGAYRRQNIPKADFNGDDHTDTLLQFLDDRLVALWIMDRAHVLEGQKLPIQPGPGWSVAAAGDMNGDKKPDIILQHTDGKIATWFMSGTTFAGGVYVGPVPGPGWRVVASGDYSGDGYRDLVLQNSTTSRIAFWNMAVSTILGGAYLPITPGPGWIVVSGGDFNNDGNQDLVLQNAKDRRVAIWYLDKEQFCGGGYVSQTPGIGWTVVGAGDYDGDDRLDLLLQNKTTNKVAEWLLNDLKIKSGAYVDVTPASGWQVAGPR